MSLKLASLPNDQPSTTLVFQSWALSVQPEESNLPTSVVPERVVITQQEDGTRTTSVTSGVPYSPPGLISNGDKLPAVGTVLWEQSYAPGEYHFLFGEPPTRASEYAEYLRSHNALPAEATSGDYLNSIPVLMTERNLTTSQEAALLEFLAGLPDLEVVGDVADRLGRDGVAISSSSRDASNYVDTIIVSPTTGHILSFETTYVGTDRTDIASPAVVAYTALEGTPQ